MAHGHAHPLPAAPGEHSRRLVWALCLTSSFLVVELIAAWITSSLALLSDAAHMLTDVAALAIAVAAVRIARRPADKKRTFGYYRFEILAAAINALMLFAIAIYIGWEAWQRLREPYEVASLPMLLVAVIGLVVNLVSMRLLRAGSSESMNMKGAYLEVWSDMIGSLGVMAAAALIWLSGWHWIDSVVGIGIALWVLPRTWTLLKEAINVLLQGVPSGIDMDELEAELSRADGVREVHALHVWSLSSGRPVLSAHLVVDPRILNDDTFLGKLNHTLEHRFGLRHTTVQLESRDSSCPHPDG